MMTGQISLATARKNYDVWAYINLCVEFLKNKTILCGVANEDDY